MRLMFLPLAVLGCGSVDDPIPDPLERELTCELLEDPSNCWSEAASALAECLPGVNAQGTLSPDRGSCSFDDGTEVVFDSPIPMTLFELEGLGFTVVTGGQTCGTFLDTFDNEIIIDAGGSSATVRLRGDLSLTCEGGPTYSTEFDTIFTCEPGAGPTDGFDVTENEVYVQIIASSSQGRLFTCTP